MFAFGAAMKKYKFKATIEGGPGGGAGVTFPYDVEKEFGTKASVPVKATVDGAPYSGSLMNCGMSNHMLCVLKGTREKIGKGVGDEVEVVVRRDEELRTVETPPDFEKLLKKEGLLVGFKKLSYTHQKEYVRWITEAKKEETRQNRMTKAMAMLKSGIKTPG
jgi:bifunctional DNA-binding transcriptional regulator/antitoxin component of YhaV-PrlF toxin-antitoxin module